MNMNRIAYKLTISGALSALLFFLAACSTGGEPVELDTNVEFGHRSSSGDVVKSSSSQGNSGGDSLDSLVEWSAVPSMVFARSGVSFSVNAFGISATEVTQGLYVKMMGDMPSQNYARDDYPIENVNWYQAVLFCNEYSKYLGLDTAYVYTSVGEKSFLADLSIDYGAESIRLPTEMEWEVAARGGTTSTYYWGNDVASKYAYYGQNKGPAEVANRIDNAYSLYDMAGNVAEWVNDWYGAFPTKESKNYTGVSQGSSRVVRGGGWNDPIKDCAPDVREKKDPLYASHALGFRVVYSKGF